MHMRSPGRSTLFFALVVLGCAEGPDPYLGQTPPGDVPVVFASGVVSLDDRFEQFLLYAPDGRSLTYGLTNADWSQFTLRTMAMQDGRWSEAFEAPFLGSDPSALTSSLTADGRTVFFSSARPTYPPVDIWTSTVRDDGTWSEPVRVPEPVSSEGDEFEVVVSAGGTLYFSSTREGGLGDIDIYRARLVEDGYPAIENLGAPVNGPSGDDLPYIAPDESYLIFASDRPGGFGYRDLYVTFAVDGVWSEPVNLGRPINSEAWDIYPSVSPDGKYLFFTRRASWEATEDSDVYWVRADFLERLRGTLPGRGSLP